VFPFPFQIRWLPKRKGHARLLHTLIAIQHGGIIWAVSTRVNLRSAQREFGNAGECDSVPRIKLLLRHAGIGRLLGRFCRLRANLPQDKAGHVRYLSAKTLATRSGIGAFTDPLTKVFSLL
jgi:hypothetical protein